jgi:uridine phosphorylase
VLNRVRFRGIDFAPTADFGALRTAYDVAVQRGIDIHVGPIASWDAFYAADPTLLMQLADYGVLAVEMESAALFTLAAGAGARALTICQGERLGGDGRAHSFRATRTRARHNGRARLGDRARVGGRGRRRLAFPG